MIPRQDNRSQVRERRKKRLAGFSSETKMTAEEDVEQVDELKIPKDERKYQESSRSCAVKQGTKQIPQQMCSTRRGDVEQQRVNAVQETKEGRTVGEMQVKI